MHTRVSVHVRCVEGVLGLVGHIVIGVVFGVTSQTSYQVQISFFRVGFVVHFCSCSQTVFCDRQLFAVASLAHFCMAKTGQLMLHALHKIFLVLLQRT